MNETISYEIKEVTWPAKTFLVKRATRSFSDLPDFFGESYGMIYGALAQQGKSSDEPPFAFYYSIDKKNKTTDVGAAVEVPEDISPVPGLEKVVLPSSKLITTIHYGSFESMVPAYAEMEAYLKSKKLNKELNIEQYFSDPEEEKDPSKWKTAIYFLVNG